MMKALLFLITLQLAVAPFSFGSESKEGSLSDDVDAVNFQAIGNDWDKLNNAVRILLTKLQVLIETAKAQGMTTEYAEGSVHVVETFLKAAQHDHENVEEIRAAFKRFPYYDKTDPMEADNLAYNELRACIQVTERAIEELELQLSGAIELTRPPDLSKGAITLGPGYYRQDGRPIYPYTMIWAPKEADDLQHFGRMGGMYYSVSQLPENRQLSKGFIQHRVNTAEKQSVHNMAPMVVFNGNSPADWMVEAYPEITQGARHFTRYDIDHPLVRETFDSISEQLLEEVIEASPDLPHIHMLANEPHFATAERGWLSKNGVSDYTMAKYRAWLKKKYKTIETLNRTYQTDCDSFDEVIFYSESNEQSEESYRQRQISKDLRGGPVWYDWCRFNQIRVNEWFRFLKETTQKHDGIKAPVAIKMLGYTLSRNTRDGGMDIEYLTKLQDVISADLRVLPQGATIYGKHEEGVDPAIDWRAKFAYDWIDQAMFLDFSKSLSTDKAFYDSEWHGFSSTSWRHFNLSAEYVRSAIWLAFMDGMSLINPWVWGRDESGAFKNQKYNFIGELPTQPVALDAYSRVMKELNAHADWLAPGVQQYERHLMIYYCEESAIQDEAYTDKFKNIYQAAKLMNLPIGFTTSSEISSLDTTEYTVLVPPTSFISDSSLAALDAYQQKGGKVILIGAENSFLKNELGQDRVGYTFAKPYASLSYVNWPELIPVFEKVLRALVPNPEIEISTFDSDGNPSYGVIQREMAHPDSGETIVVLNNVSKFPQTLQTKDILQLENMLTKEAVTFPYEMKSEEVMVLEKPM